jgi:hypothetical protein
MHERVITLMLIQFIKKYSRRRLGGRQARGGYNVKKEGREHGAAGPNSL